MRSIAILTATIFVFFSSPAFAHHHHRHHHSRHYTHHHHAQRHIAGKYLDQDGGKHKLFLCPGCVLEDTLAGVVSVAKENADRFVGLINDLVKAGFKGPVDCASASRSHVPGSKHYSGNACDFDQCGWGCTPHIMHTAEAAAIIRKWGFTNGCRFRDCGHVGTDEQGHAIASRQHHHYARHHYRHYAAR